MSSWFFPAREATDGNSLAASGAAGSYGADPVDPNDPGYRRVGGSRREVPHWTLEKARTFSVHAYRTNPMGRAIIDTYTSFCVGDSGLTLSVNHPDVEEIARGFWDDPRNDLDNRQESLLRSHMLMGESALEMMVGGHSGATLFSYIDPSAISRVELEAGNPLWPSRLIIGGISNEIPLTIARVDDLSGLRGGEALFWPSWRALESDRRGVPFLSPVLDWLNAYDDVLYNLVDRTKLLRYFVWDVTVNGDGKDIEDFVKGRGGRHAPPSGSVEVHNEAVEWKAQTPSVGAYEDKVTSQSVLTEIAAGSGLAKTWLAEPEDANRATSLTMAEPVRRRVSGVQKMWVGRMTELVKYAVDQAVAVRRLDREVTIKTETGEKRIPAADTVKVTGPEIAASDAKVNAEILVNLATAITGLRSANAMTPEAGRILVKKAWEQFVGVPYRPELDRGDETDPAKLEDYIDDETESLDRERRRRAAVHAAG